MTDMKTSSTPETRNEIPSSLRYPKLDLTSALEKIKTLFAKNSTNAMLRAAMSADLGYADGSGRVNSVLASLKYYGLLEATPNDRYKIDDSIINYCLDNSLPLEGVKKCLFSVPVNKKLFAAYDIDNLPGLNELKAFLIKECKYSLKEATAYMDIFQCNQAIYDALKNGVRPNTPSVESMSIQPSTPVALSPASPTQPWRPNARSYTHPLKQGRFIAIQLPDLNDLDLQDLEDANDLLTLALTKIERRIRQLQTTNA